MRKSFQNRFSSAHQDHLRQRFRFMLPGDPLRIPIDEAGWPPIEFANERGERSGMSGDYLRLVEERLGVKFEQTKELTWQAVYARQKRWEIEVATCEALTPQRTEFRSFTKP